eukprot:330488_1
MGSGPNIIPNQIIQTHVSLIDLTATFLGYAEINKAHTAMTSISLKPFLNGTWSDNENQYRNYILSGLNPWRLVIKQINSSVTWKFICVTQLFKNKIKDLRVKKSWKHGTSKLLYNIADDLYEQHNVAHIYPNVVNELQTLLPQPCKIKEQVLSDIQSLASHGI